MKKNNGGQFLIPTDIRAAANNRLPTMAGAVQCETVCFLFTFVAGDGYSLSIRHCSKRQTVK
jgi:hypothetical protein